MTKLTEILSVKVIEAQLRDKITPQASEKNPQLKCPIKFRIHGHSGARISIKETDHKVDIYINPRKIRSQEMLDHTLDECRAVLIW